MKLATRILIGQLVLGVAAVVAVSGVFYFIGIGTEATSTDPLIAAYAADHNKLVAAAQGFLLATTALCLLGLLALGRRVRDVARAVSGAR